MSAMSDDVYGLGIAGLGYGGFAQGFSANGYDLMQGGTGGRGGAGGDALSTAALLANSPAARKKLVGDMVELLEKHRALHSWEAFALLSTVDLALPGNARLLEDLSKNLKVTLDTAKRTITYKVSPSHRPALSPLHCTATDRPPAFPPPLSHSRLCPTCTAARTSCRRCSSTRSD